MASSYTELFRQRKGRAGPPEEYAQDTFPGTPPRNRRNGPYSLPGSVVAGGGADHHHHAGAYSLPPPSPPRFPTAGAPHQQHQQQRQLLHQSVISSLGPPGSPTARSVFSAPPGRGQGGPAAPIPGGYSGGRGATTYTTGARSCASLSPPRRPHRRQPQQQLRRRRRVPIGLALPATRSPLPLSFALQQCLPQALVQEGRRLSLVGKGITVIDSVVVSGGPQQLRGGGGGARRAGPVLTTQAVRRVTAAFLSDNDLTSCHGMEQFACLRSLSLANNLLRRIEDLKPLADLPLLESLLLEGNPVTDEPSYRLCVIGLLTHDGPSPNTNISTGLLTLDKALITPQERAAALLALRRFRGFVEQGVKLAAEATQLAHLAALLRCHEELRERLYRRQGRALPPNGSGAFASLLLLDPPPATQPQNQQQAHVIEATVKQLVDLRPFHVVVRGDPYLHRVLEEELRALAEPAFAEARRRLQEQTAKGQLLYEGGAATWDWAFQQVLGQLRVRVEASGQEAQAGVRVARAAAKAAAVAAERAQQRAQQQQQQMQEQEQEQQQRAASPLWPQRPHPRQQPPPPQQQQLQQPAPLDTTAPAHYPEAYAGPRSTSRSWPLQAVAAGGMETSGSSRAPSRASTAVGNGSARREAIHRQYTQLLRKRFGASKPIRPTARTRGLASTTTTTTITTTTSTSAPSSPERPPWRPPGSTTSSPTRAANLDRGLVPLPAAAAATAPGSYFDAAADDAGFGADRAAQQYRQRQFQRPPGPQRQEGLLYVEEVEEAPVLLMMGVAEEEDEEGISPRARGPPPAPESPPHPGECGAASPVRRLAGSLPPQQREETEEEEEDEEEEDLGPLLVEADAVAYRPSQPLPLLPEQDPSVWDLEAEERAFEAAATARLPAPLNAQLPAARSIKGLQQQVASLHDEVVQRVGAELSLYRCNKALRRKLEACRQQRLEASDLADAHVGIAEAEVARLGAGVEALRAREAGVGRLVAATQRELARAEAGRALVPQVEAGIARCEAATREALATREKLRARLAAAREEVAQGVAFVGSDLALAAAAVEREALERADAFRLQQLRSPGARLHRLVRAVLFARGSESGSLYALLQRRRAQRLALAHHQARVARVQALWGLWRWRQRALQHRALRVLALRRHRATQAAVLAAWRRQVLLARRVRRWQAARLRRQAKAALRLWAGYASSADRARRGQGALEGRQLLRRCFGAWRAHLGRVRYLDPVAAAAAAGRADACRLWLAWRRLRARVAAAKRARQEVARRLRGERVQALVARCFAAWRGAARRARLEWRLLHADDRDVEDEDDEEEDVARRAWSSRAAAPEAPTALRALEALLRRRMAGKARRALLRWRRWARGAHRRETALRTVVGRVHMRRIGQGLALWRAGTVAQRRLEAVLAKRAEQRARRLGRRVLWAWALVARRQRLVEGKEARLAELVKTQRARRLLTAWRSVLLQRRVEASAVAKAEHRLRWYEEGAGRRAARRAFGRWWAWAAARGEQRALEAWAGDAWARRRLRVGVKALEARPLRRRLGALRAARGERDKLARDCAAADQQLQGLHRALARVEREVDRTTTQTGTGRAAHPPTAMERVEKVAFLRGKVEAMEAELARRMAHLAAVRERKRREAEAATAALSPQRRAGAIKKAPASPSPSPSPSRVAKGGSSGKAAGRKNTSKKAAAVSGKASSSSTSKEAALEVEERRLARALLELGRRAQQKARREKAQHQQRAAKPLSSPASSSTALPPEQRTAASSTGNGVSRGQRELGRVEARLQACLATLEALPGAAAAERARGHKEVARLDRELRRLRGAVDAEARRLSPQRKGAAASSSLARPIPEATSEVEEEEEEEEEEAPSQWWPPLPVQPEEEASSFLSRHQHQQQQQQQHMSLLEEDESLQEVWDLAGEVERVSSRLSRLQQRGQPPAVQQQQP